MMDKVSDFLRYSFVGRLLLTITLIPCLLTVGAFIPSLLNTFIMWDSNFIIDHISDREFWVTFRRFIVVISGFITSISAIVSAEFGNHRWL